MSGSPNPDPDTLMARPPTPQAIRKLLASAGGEIAARLPPGWQSSVEARTTDGGVVRFTAPDGKKADVRALVRKRLDPRSASALPRTGEPAIVVTDWLSPRTRTILAEAGLGYADTTGNVLVRVSDPGLSITAEGASRDPSPRSTTMLNLRGPRAWALERTLAEVLPPYGVSELSAALGMDAGYVSRLLGGLADELIIERPPRQPVAVVNWEAMVEQITRTYSLLESNDTTSWIAPGGPEQFLRDLSSSKLKRWAVTGSFASSRLVTVAAPEIAVVYTDDPERLADSLRLRPTRTGGNVVTALPYDFIVYERTWERDDLLFASVTQIAIDCLTGFGRMPAEGDALLAWMRQRAPRWQSSSLTGTGKLP
jgi:hypothetical protein